MAAAIAAHAIAAPIFFAIVSWICYDEFNCTKLLQAATVFVGFAILAHFLVVAPSDKRSLEIVTSLLGTRIPSASSSTRRTSPAWRCTNESWRRVGRRSANPEFPYPILIRV
jgi:hypothetical protein